MIYEVYAVAAEVSETFRDRMGQSLQEVLKETEERLVTEFTAKYGYHDEMWRQLLERNA